MMLKYQNPDFLEMYRSGATNTQMGAHFGVTPDVIQGWARRARRDGLLGLRVSPVVIPVEELRALVAQGVSDVEIAKRYGLYRTGVQRQRAAAGITAAKAVRTKPLASIEARFRELYAQGMRIKDIGLELGVGDSRARQIVIDLGLTRQKPKPMHLHAPAVRKKAAETRRANLGLAPRPSPRLKAVEKTPEVIPDHARPWLTRKFGDGKCAYPYGERGNIHSCCKPTFNGTSWCEGHAALCFDYRRAA